MHRYYLTERPADMGTFPNKKDNKPTTIFNFDKKIYIRGIKHEAWGYVSYVNKLTQKEISDYELMEGKVWI